MNGFWSRATLALGLALYGWSMMGVDLYLRAAAASAGPSKNLAEFRRLLMGRGVLALGAAAILAAIVLALIARRHNAARVASLLLAAAWIACLAMIWPI